MIEVSDQDVQVFIDTMREKTCYDFSNYSPSSLKRRLARILNENNFEMDQLTGKINADMAFSEKVACRVTVCTTELFRDPEIWISLKDEIILSCNNTRQLNIWHVGCSTGQEVYSMMILLNEINLLERCNIYATDLNKDALDIAKAGEYKYLLNKNYIDNFNHIFNTTGSKLIPYEKYFTINTVNDTIRMNAFLREKPVYKKTDLVKEENPFHVIFDAIICRNVIIYFNYELQNKVLNLFYRNLSDNGCILLGAHESLTGPYSTVFEKRFQGCYKKTTKT